LEHYLSYFIKYMYYFNDSLIKGLIMLGIYFNESNDDKFIIDYW
jgi:hypothetical protein